MTEGQSTARAMCMGMPSRPTYMRQLASRAASWRSEVLPRRSWVQGTAGSPGLPIWTTGCDRIRWAATSANRSGNHCLFSSSHFPLRPLLWMAMQPR